MKTFWGRYLPEAGTSIKRMSRDIEAAHKEVEELQAALKAAKAECKKLEAQFSEYISGNWSEEEIETAKATKYETID